MSFFKKGWGHRHDIHSTKWIQWGQTVLGTLAAVYAGFAHQLSVLLGHPVQTGYSLS
uniref:Uncharacterized protein n=1 Tax=Anguilla anguilla TaxID=7936 RepID=A0A0E9REZ4_ANGAN